MVLLWGPGIYHTATWTLWGHSPCMVALNPFGRGFGVYSACRMGKTFLTILIAEVAESPKGPCSYMVYTWALK